MSNKKYLPNFFQGTSLKNSIISFKTSVNCCYLESLLIKVMGAIETPEPTGAGRVS